MGKTKLTRRQFVSTLTVGTGTVLLGNTALSVPSHSPGIFSDQLKIVKLGNSGLKSSLLGMGTGFSGISNASDITRAGTTESVIRQAYEKGIRFFDCADSYGSHPSIASALRGIPRENYTLSTKLWVNHSGIHEGSNADVSAAVNRFRKELNTDYIDLIQIHCMTDAHWTDKQKREMEILDNLKSKRIIMAHGVSVHSLEAMEACIGNSWIDAVHVRINPYGESMDNNNPTLVIPIIEKLHSEGKGIIGMKINGAGKFKNDSDKIDTSLKFVLGLGVVDTIIVGFEFPEQIDNYILRIHNTLKSVN
jgi:predicted aldo/keto reductase-like oxidoreductase